MTIGARNTADLVIHTGWDAAALESHKLEDGTTYAQVVAEMNTALNALNNEIFNNPTYAAAISYTDEPAVEYRTGSTNGFARFTENSRPDAQRAELEGHMLPLVDFDRGLGWSWKYLQKARMTQIRADITEALQDARDVYRQNVLARVLQRGDDSGASKGLGTGGYSPGFATAAANTNVDFTPPRHEANEFTVDHEHYVAVTGGFTKTIFDDIESELKEHGHRGPFIVWISESDKEVVKAISGFASVANPLIEAASSTSVARVDATRFIGVIGECMIEIVPGMPQYYGFGFKSYGANSQRNPLRIRTSKGVSRPRIVAMPDPRAGNGTSPLQYLMLYTEFGIGVADRTAGTPRFVNNAAWSDGVAL